MQLLPDDAWAYEIGPRNSSRRGPSLAVRIPDATPSDRPFTPMTAIHALASMEDGHSPWPMIVRFMRLVQQYGDIVADGQHELVIGDLISMSRSRSARAALLFQRMFE